MDEKAKVIEVRAASVVVQSQIKSTCSQCQQVDTCGSGQVAKALPQPKLTVEIATQDSFNIGDEVIISIPEQALLAVAWQVYLLPLFGLMLGAGVGQYLLSGGWLLHEWHVIVIAITSAWLGFKLAKKRLACSKHQQQLTPTIKQRLVAGLVTDQG